MKRFPPQTQEDAQALERSVPPQPYLKEWDERIVRLQRENERLRAALKQVSAFQISEVLARHDSRGADVCKEWLEIKKTVRAALSPEQAT